MSEGNIGAIFDAIGEKARASLPLSDNDIRAIANRPETEEAALGGSIDQDFSLKIVNGVGSTQESKSTYGVTIKGTFAVKSPSDGTWTMVAKVAGKTVIDKSGVKVGQKIPFTAKTNFWSKTKIEITCTWSEKKNTTLVVHLKASY